MRRPSGPSPHRISLLSELIARRIQAMTTACEHTQRHWRQSINEDILLGTTRRDNDANIPQTIFLCLCFGSEPKATTCMNGEPQTTIPQVSIGGLRKRTSFSLH